MARRRLFYLHIGHGRWRHNETTRIRFAITYQDLNGRHGNSITRRYIEDQVQSETGISLSLQGPRRAAELVGRLDLSTRAVAEWEIARRERGGYRWRTLQRR